MKTLTLIRHAKSSWNHDVTDIQRPLSIRGINDANLLSNELLNRNFKVDAIFSSPANRAFTTCSIFIERLNLPQKLLTVDKRLYDFGGRQVVEFIRDTDDNLGHILVFGHNHAFTDIANRFGDEFIDNVPTCGMVTIEFNVDSWKNIDKGHTKMTLFPRDLKS